jgi:bacteriorhodopsin
MKTKTAITAFLIFAIILALPPLALIFTDHPNLLVPHFWLIFAFITGLTFLVMVAIIITKQVNPENYAQTFLATTVFKLLACLAFLVVFIMKIKVDKPVFVGNFFYLYFLNTAFEVYVLLRNLRNQNLK